MSQTTPCFLRDFVHAAEKSLAHQQTRAEFEASRGGIGQFVHRELVRVALAAHQFVPKKVLAEYPDLLVQNFRTPGFFLGAD